MSYVWSRESGLLASMPTRRDANGLSQILLLLQQARSRKQARPVTLGNIGDLSPFVSSLSNMDLIET
jgi:hypothetical protein